MKYSIETLTRDVMARLGEVPRPQQSLPSPSSDFQADSQTPLSGIPWPQDMMALKVRGLLPEVGSRLIREASLPLEGNVGEGTPCSVGLEVSASLVSRLMPCGLYAVEVQLPEDFLRIGSAKMGEWLHSVSETVAPRDSDWACQWSSEPGIAGCPTRPRAYLDSGSAGLLLRLVGSEGGEDALEWLRVWRIPVADEEGRFRFPAVIYPELVSALTKRLSEEQINY